MTPSGVGLPIATVIRMTICANKISSSFLWMLLGISAVSLGCGDSAKSSSDGSVALDGAEPTCASLAESFAAAAASLPRSCETVADCYVAGEYLNSEEPTCDCAAWVPVHPVSGAAYAGSEAEALFTQLEAECATSPDVTICDQGPFVVTCEDNQCTGTSESCFDMLTPDAGA